MVDDQQDFIDLAVDGLKDLVPGAKVEGACGGYEALLRIGSFQPSILLLDLRMPGLDGFEVCRRVKEAPATKATRIVAMTGFADEEAQQLAMTCGADAFVTKREGLTALGRQIKGLLDADAAPGGVASQPVGLPRELLRPSRAPQKRPRGAAARDVHGVRGRAGLRAGGAQPEHPVGVLLRPRRLRARHVADGA